MPETNGAAFHQHGAAHREAILAYIGQNARYLGELAENNPGHAWMQLEAARLAIDLRQPQAALGYLGAAFKANTTKMLLSWDYWQIMAAVQSQLGDQGEGEAAIEMALKIAPRMPLLWARAAAFAYHRGDQLEASVREAEALKYDAKDPEDRHAQGDIHLLNQNWKKGWELYEARLERRSIGQWAKDLPRWDGKPMPGKRLLVWGEQGQGDQIMFLRFLRILREFSKAEIVLRVHPALAEWAILGLMAPLGEDIVSSVNPEGDVSFDAQVSLLSLPHALGIQGLGVAPYAPKIGEDGIVPDAVGWCCQGNAYMLNDHDRSFPDAEEFIAQVFRDVDPVIPRVCLHGDRFGSWIETACAIRGCRVVVTTDTALPHIAGSLGVPTILIAPSAGDWRHGRRGGQHPWYPSMRVVRKRYIQGWPQAFEEVRELLKRDFA